MHATWQLKPDDMDENFLHAVKSMFQNHTIEIAISDVPDNTVMNAAPRKAGALKGRIKISPDFNAPLSDFDEYRI